MNSYWFAARSEEVEHRHPFLVFDCQDQLHVPLTRFGKEASLRTSLKTAQTYLYALTPFFTYQETDVWERRAGYAWDAPPRQVRQAVEDYLVQKLQCKVQPHQQGWQYVSLTARTHSSLRVFLAALKLFYQIMREHGTYTFSNPMIDTVSATVAAVQARLDHEENVQDPPRMPEHSGVEEPHPKPTYRLTDSYFKLKHEEWVPQIIDDPTLPGMILKGGKKLSLKSTRLRDEVVTWLLFETGARVSEVTGLTLGDWDAFGMHTKARAFNKGSHGRRTKTLSFADDTVILLKRYFDEERIRFDPRGYALDDYLQLSKRKQIDLQMVSLFLTVQRTQLTPKEYREHSWNPACQAIGIEADVHQARHWLVTRSVRDIYETAKSKEEIERRLRDLIEYMKWRSEETLAAYQHYFDGQRDADIRDAFQRHIHQEVLHYLEERSQGKQVRSQEKQQSTITASAPQLAQLDDEPNLGFLYSLAGEA